MSPTTRLETSLLPIVCRVASISPINRSMSAADTGRLAPAMRSFLPHGRGGRFTLADQPVNVGRRHRALGARDAQAARQLLAVELFARAVLLDDERRSQNGALVGA